MFTKKVPKKGILYWVNFSPTQGHEQAGRRPALVVSSDYFNTRSGGIVWAIPITSKVTGAGKLTVPEGLPISGAFILSQIRTLDANAREFDEIGSIPQDLLDDICGRLASVLVG